MNLASSAKGLNANRETLFTGMCVEHAYFDGESGNIEAAAREVRYAAARRYVREHVWSGENKTTQKTF